MFTNSGFIKWVVIGCALAAGSLTGCTEDDAAAPPTESMAEAMDDSAMEHAAKHLDPKYVCPMHPQIVRDEPGSCPICGMDLVAQAVERADQSAMEHAVKHLDPKYVCPMHPQIVRDEPGSCPICGMDLVEQAIEEGGDGHPTVAVRGEIQQSMGVRTTAVARETLWKFVRTVGRVDYDETVLSHVHPRAEGWMERLVLRAEGEQVEQGQLLGDFYSPEILSAQVDFLVSLDYTGTAARERVEKARNRLRLLGVTEAAIQDIEKRRQTRNTIPVVAPQSGIVTGLMSREGMYVTPSSELFTIVDLSRVWVLVDVYEHQIDWIEPGAAAEIRVPAHPGRVWEGEVDYLYPELDPKSRTLRVRLVFDNPDRLLRPNMFAEVKIFGGPKKDVLAVPREAVIVTGERETVVKALGEGRFQPVDVVTGMRGRDSVEILGGLREGDEVVVSGQFLIDSESSLQASFQRMAGGDEKPAEDAGMHQH